MSFLKYFSRKGKKVSTKNTKSAGHSEAPGPNVTKTQKPFAKKKSGPQAVFRRPKGSSINQKAPSHNKPRVKKWSQADKKKLELDEAYEQVRKNLQHIIQPPERQPGKAARRPKAKVISQKEVSVRQRPIRKLRISSAPNKRWKNDHGLDWATQNRARSSRVVGISGPLLGQAHIRRMAQYQRQRKARPSRQLLLPANRSRSQSRESSVRFPSGFNNPDSCQAKSREQRWRMMNKRQFLSSPWRGEKSLDSWRELHKSGPSWPSKLSQHRTRNGVAWAEDERSRTGVSMSTSVYTGTGRDLEVLRTVDDIKIREIDRCSMASCIYSARSSEACEVERRASILHLYGTARSPHNLNDLRMRKSSSEYMGDPRFFKDITRAVYHSRLTELLEKYRKTKWSADFVNKKLNEHKGMYHELYVLVCKKYGEEPADEYIPQSENNIGTWDFDMSSRQLCIYEFTPSKYNWRMYSRERVEDLFNIVENIRKLKQRLVLRFIDNNRTIYKPIKFTIMKQKKVAARKHGSFYRWKYKVEGVDMAEIRIILYPYDKVLKLDWIQIKRFEMSGTQMMQLLMTFCDYLQFTMRLTDSSGGIRASSIIRKGKSWYETLGFEYDQTVAERFTSALDGWSQIQMNTTKGDQKVLMDDLQDKKFQQTLASLRKRKSHDENTLKHVDKVLISRGKHQDSKWRLSGSRSPRESVQEISILEFTKRVYNTYSECRAIEKEWKQDHTLSPKEVEQLSSIRTHIEDLVNRMDGYLRKNPRTKRGYKTLFEKEYPMSRECTAMSETAFMASVISKIKPPNYSETDINTINSVDLSEKRKRDVVERLSRNMRGRSRRKLIMEIPLEASNLTRLSNEASNTDNGIEDKMEKSSVANVKKRDAPQTSTFSTPSYTRTPNTHSYNHLDDNDDLLLGRKASNSPSVIGREFRLTRLNSSPACWSFRRVSMDSKNLAPPDFSEKAASEPVDWDGQDYSPEPPSTLSKLTSELTVHTELLKNPVGEIGEYRRTLKKILSRHRKGEKLKAGVVEGFTPLMLAVISSDKDKVDYLIKDRSKLNFRDAVGRTALFTATTLGYKDMVEKLLLAGARLVKTLTGRHVLDYAKECEEWEVVRLLYTYCQPPKVRNHKQSQSYYGYAPREIFGQVV